MKTVPEHEPRYAPSLVESAVLYLGMRKTGTSEAAGSYYSRFQTAYQISPDS